MPTYTTGNPQSTTSPAVPPGTYAFRVAEALDTVSTNQNEMISLVLYLLKDGDVVGKAYDKLVFTKSKRADWKIDQFLHSIGHHPGAGVEDHDVQARPLIGEEGLAEIANETGDKGGIFNAVVRYLSPGGF